MFGYSLRQTTISYRGVVKSLSFFSFRFSLFALTGLVRFHSFVIIFTFHWLSKEQSKSIICTNSRPQARCMRWYPSKSEEDSIADNARRCYYDSSQIIPEFFISQLSKLLCFVEFVKTLRGLITIAEISISVSSIVSSKWLQSGYKDSLNAWEIKSGNKSKKVVFYCTQSGYLVKSNSCNSYLKVG